MEVVCHDGKKVLWEVDGDHVTEEPTDNDYIGVWGLISICSTKTRRG